MGEYRDLFSTVAREYGSFRPSYPRQLVDRLADLAPARELAWDVGAGSGQLARVLALRFERVIACDASAAQVARAEAHPRIEYRVERAAPASLVSRSADLIVAAQAAHWFDLDRFFAEVRRVAKPGGLVALVGYGHAQLESDVEPMFVDFCARALGPHWPPERRHVLASYRDLAFPFEELEFPPLALEATLDARAFLGYVGTWSALAPFVRAGGAGEYRRFQRDLRAIWGPPGSSRRVRWPLFARVGRLEG